ncbi:MULTISPECIES: glycosyltransferase family 4 protein [Metabacillus]|uniref:Glycosyltransferase family 4 protein n=2 Tax=Metabacillus TaxID=2675233 RepID=A0A179T168_9BACI|nr:MULTISPECIES: glycosyltransferase family 4 protein [Metabacillus]OAS87846.1 hypothetical protein A6K24_19130 [Metabacillus litoralis]QNF27349.1 glycosyltransferase [Metabacillus sp. KUDC1714]
MHILIPVFFNAPLGGLHFNVMSTALHCKSNGNDVTVLCRPGVFTDTLKEKGINVINTDFTPTEFSNTIKTLLELNKSNKIDIIHSHPFESRKVAVLLSKILKSPLFVTIHGRHTDYIETYIDKVAMVFTVSEGIKDFLKVHLAKNRLNKYNHKLFVVPNGVDTHLFQPIEPPALNRKINISLVTRLDKDKEFIIEVFYKALKFTTEKYPNDVIWTIVGDGTLIDEMKQKVEEIVGTNNHFVNFVGWKEDIDLLMSYSNSDIVIAPGRCALEAMSCGKPTIAIGSKGYIGLIDKNNWLKGVYANFGGIGNKIEDYVEGSIEKDIERLVENDMLRDELGELGHNLISQFYEEKEANNNLLRFYSMFKRENTELNEIDHIEIDKLISNYLLETNIRQSIIKQNTLNEYKIEVICHEYNGLSFAWYVFKEKQLVKKIPYSKSNCLNYTFQEKGSYQIRCYVKKDDTMIVFPVKKINV